MKYLTYADLSAATGIPAPTIRVMAMRGKLPEPSVRLGQSPGWSGSAIAEWIAANKRA